jgi:hypothetical protein
MLREVAPARLAAAGAVQVMVKPPREPAMAALRRQGHAARCEAQNRAAASGATLGDGEPGHCRRSGTRASIATRPVARNSRGSTGCLPRRSSK